MLQLTDIFRRARMREVERAVRLQFDDPGVFHEDALSTEDVLASQPEYASRSWENAHGC